MAEGKIKITLSIAGENYPMAIDASKEELYREAARRLNAQIAEYAKVTKFGVKDRLAMAALAYSIKVVSYERESSLGDADMQELDAIEKRISSYIKE